MKLQILFFLLIFFNLGYSQKEINEKSTYNLLVKIDGLRRNYAGCGVRFYSISVVGQVQKQTDKTKFGDEVTLIFKCPETLNKLPVGTMYDLNVVLNDDIKVDMNIEQTNKDTLSRKKLLVLSAKVVPQL